MKPRSGRLCSNASTKAERSVTFREFAERWVSGDLHRDYLQRVPMKRTAHLDRYRADRHINPLVGDFPLAAFTTEHAEDVMRRLPSRLSPASCRHVAQILRRVLTLAVFPAQIVDRSPLTRGFLPKVERKKAPATCSPMKTRYSSLAPRSRSYAGGSVAFSIERVCAPGKRRP